MDLGDMLAGMRPHVVLAIASVCLFAGCGGGDPATMPDAAPAPDAAPEPDAVPALPNGIYRVAGLEADLPADDLAPLGALLGDATVVGLGESIHTSGGYSQAKFRLFRYLVEQLGFRAFAWESPWTNADAVARYVATCEGDPVEALAGLFGVWANTSVRDLIQWMCAYNQEHPDDPLVFFGFDVQQPWDDMALLREFFLRAAPGDAEAQLAALATCDGVAYESEAEYYAAEAFDIEITADAHASCTSGVATVRAYLDAHEAALVAATSADDLAIARIAATGIASWASEKFYYATDYEASYEARDVAMAEVFHVLRAQRAPGAKTALWAHNAHIAHAGDRIEGFHFQNMGAYLAATLGEEYQAIGLVGYDVAINWPGQGSGPLPAPIDDFVVEKRLHNLGEPYLLVDLDFPGAETPFLEAGEAYDLGGIASFMVPREQFRALLFLDVSPEMDALFW